MLSYLIILLTVDVYFAQVGNFIIGFTNREIRNYVQQTNYSNFNYEIIEFNTQFTMTSNGYKQGPFKDGKQYHAIIGEFIYDLAIYCIDNNLTYFIIDKQINRSPRTRALLDFAIENGFNGATLGYLLRKYNWIQNIKFISDSSENAMEILWSISGEIIPQCNFNAGDTEPTINEAFSFLKFNNTPGTVYIIVADDNNIALVNRIMTQFMYRSMPFQSYIFFPMLKTEEIIKQYSYTGGVLYTLKQTQNNSQNTSSLITINAMNSFQFIYDTIKNNKLTNISTTVTKEALLEYFYKSFKFDKDGLKTTYTFYWSAYKNGAVLFDTPISVLFKNFYSIEKNIPDPKNIAATDFITTAIIEDVTFSSRFTELDLSKTRKGFAVFALKALLLPLNLSYIIKEVSGTGIGRYNSTFSNGLMLAMVNRDADMTAIPVPRVNSYLTKFDYSENVFVVPYSILIKKRSKSLDLLRLVKPFSSLVWLMIIVTIGFLGIILWLTNLISPNIGENIDKLTISNSIFMVIGSFLIAKMLVKPNMLSTQLFYLLIWLSALLLIASYVANLCIFIAFDLNQLIPFSSLNDLIRQGSLKWVFVEDSILHNKILIDIETRNTSSVLRSIFEYAKTNWKDKYLLNTTANITDFLMNNQEFGILNDLYHNLQYSLQDCSLTTLPDPINNFSMAYLFQEGFKYKTQISQQIIAMKISGEMHNLEGIFMNGKCPTAGKLLASTAPFTILDMAGLFILIAIGIVISLPISLIEYLAQKSQLQCQRTSTGSSLQFGKVYKAKVKTLDKNGVTVDIGRLGLCSSKTEGRIYYVHKKYLGIKRKEDRELMSPTDQGIMIGTKLLLKYMGNNPVDSKRIFVQVQKK